MMDTLLDQSGKKVLSTSAPRMFGGGGGHLKPPLKLLKMRRHQILQTPTRLLQKDTDTFASTDNRMLPYSVFTFILLSIFNYFASLLGLQRPSCHLLVILRVSLVQLPTLKHPKAFERVGFDRYQ